MFGLVGICRHDEPEMRLSWRSHMCGQCLAARDTFGQIARATTNRDAILLSLLVDAFAAESPTDELEVGRCPLRRMKRATVVNPASSLMRGAASVSLSMATARLEDALTDDDVPRAARPVVRGVARRWRARAVAAARSCGISIEDLYEVLDSNAELEAVLGLRFGEYSAPAEEIYRECAHRLATSYGAEAPEPMLAIAARIGRLVLLVDALEDLEADLESGSFNPLTAAVGFAAAREHGAAIARTETAELVRLASESVPTDTASGRLVHHLLTKKVPSRVAAACRVVQHEERLGSYAVLIGVALPSLGAIGLHDLTDDCCDACCDCCDLDDCCD